MLNKLSTHDTELLALHIVHTFTHTQSHSLIMSICLHFFHHHLFGAFAMNYTLMHHNGILEQNLLAIQPSLSLQVIEWIRYISFSAHHSTMFYFRCSVYLWKGSVRF